MNSTARNVALATAATVLPAAAAALTYPDRTRRLGHVIGDRMTGLLEDTPTHGRRVQHALTDRAQEIYGAGAAEFEDRTRRIMHTLEELTHRLDRRVRGEPEIEHHTPVALICGGIAAALIIPTVLTAVFAPQKLRDARDAVTGYFSDEEEIGKELTRMSERLESLSADIARQRDSNFDDVVSQAKKDG
ncbi:hypothetical protein [Palleronia sp.]|uniref:hypothetical protein n=1 Tax=Palleronia sp. TaxID=1940284 RepID=UPI0035C7E60E